jgi:hypothetical protein
MAVLSANGDHDDRHPRAQPRARRGLSNPWDQGRHSNMAEVKVFYDREGKTLTV